MPHERTHARMMPMPMPLRIFSQFYQSRGRRRDQWYEWDGEGASSKWSQGQ